MEFGTIRLCASQILAATSRSVVVRELEPITLGHIIGFPRSPAARLSALAEEDFVELMENVCSTAETIRRSTDVAAWNFAVKDGVAAGMPLAGGVEHVHVHAVARRAGDFAESDEVFEHIRVWSPESGVVHAPTPLEWPAEASRVARTDALMAEEATLYRANARALGLEVAPLDDAADFSFGPHVISAETLFFASPERRTVAFVNLKPLLPGHVLVSPARCVQQLHELSADEVADLWRSVRTVQRIVEDAHGATGADIGVQDGKIAGQSVPHVHVHILPRRPARL